MWKRLAFSASLGLVPVLVPTAARADGLDTHLFRPALDSRGLITVNGVEVLPENHVSIGLVLDYGRNILRPNIENSFTGTFQFNYGIANRAVVGLTAPAVLIKGPQTDEQAFQHVALHGKLELTKPTSPLGVALAAQVGVPTSDAGDPSVWFWPQAIVEKRFERLRIAANAGFRGHSPSNVVVPIADGTVRDGHRLTYGLGASYRISSAVDVLAETYATYLLSNSTAAVKPSNEALVGLKVFVEKSSYLVIGAGPRYTSGFEAADFRGVIGFIFEPTLGDRDSRSARDEEEALRDTDEDGIPDVEDACPYVKGPRTNNPRTNGCPPIPDPPKEPEDRDHDGVPDAEDACPDTPGPRHPDPKRNGCPDVLVGVTTITVFDKINFKTASAEILPESQPILDKVAKALNDHPEIVLIEVAGHADERGAEQLNLTLTQARVDSVMRALAERQVERSRLRAKGYGYYCPLEPEHNEEAWSKNRRVEFLIVKTRTGPTGVPLGCENASAHNVKPAPVP